MKFRIKSRQLAEACTTVAGAANASRSALPILNSFRIVADSGKVTVTATDLEVTLSASSEAAVETGGVIALNAPRLLSVLREISCEDIQVEAVDQFHANIIAGASRFKLYGGDPRDFPTDRHPTGAALLDIDAEVLCGALARVKFAADSSTGRPNMAGVKMEALDGKLRFIACDGRRLAFCETDIPHSTHFECLLPNKSVGLISRGSGLAGTVRVEVDQGAAYFSSAAGTIATKLISDAFPNYRKIIPTRERRVVKFNKDELRGALRRVTALHVKDSAITVTVAGSEATISITTQEVGEFQEPIAIENPRNVAVALGVNPLLLLEAIGATPGEQFPVDFGSGSEPIETDALPAFYHLLMPVRIQPR